MPIDGGIGGSIAPIATAPWSGAVRMCARGVERGTNGTPCARVEVKRNDPIQDEKIPPRAKSCMWCKCLHSSV